jgi:hypothetical protein
MKEARPKALDCSERTKNDIAAAPYNFLFFLDLDKAMASCYVYHPNLVYSIVIVKKGLFLFSHVATANP